MSDRSLSPLQGPDLRQLVEKWREEAAHDLNVTFGPCCAQTL